MIIILHILGAAVMFAGGFLSMRYFSLGKKLLFYGLMLPVGIYYSTNNLMSTAHLALFVVGIVIGILVNIFTLEKKEEEVKKKSFRPVLMNGGKNYLHK